MYRGFERDQRVKVEIKLTSDELSALVRRGKARELAIEDALHFFLDYDLLGLVQFEISERTPFLSGVTKSLGSERRHFV